MKGPRIRMALAKQVFQVYGVDRQGTVVIRRPPLAEPENALGL